MKYKEFEDTCKTWSSGGFIAYVVIALLTAVILLLLAVFFFAPETVTKFSKTSLSSSNGEQTGRVNGNGEPDTANTTDPSVQLSDTSPAEHAIPATDPSMQSAIDTTGGNNSTDHKQGLITFGQYSENATCSSLATNIESFFLTLDTRDYIQGFQLETPSDIYFPELIQKLINNPPVVSGETDDLFTILQNTAHFFRILGKRNILILKGILDRERDTFEQTLADFYHLTSNPKCLKENFNLTIDQEELYAYGGFFLNTMGGRLYLFRRDSMSRMVVNFYAILIIEQANREGRNKYGIEIKDSIDNLIVEIESSRIKLKMRDDYLDTLYDLKVKYQ